MLIRSTNKSRTKTKHPNTVGLDSRHELTEHNTNTSNLNVDTSLNTVSFCSWLPDQTHKNIKLGYQTSSIHVFISKNYFPLVKSLTRTKN